MRNLGRVRTAAGGGGRMGLAAVTETGFRAWIIFEDHKFNLTPVFKLSNFTAIYGL
jgi:hypothetical protein